MLRGVPYARAQMGRIWLDNKAHELLFRNETPFDHYKYCHGLNPSSFSAAPETSATRPPLRWVISPLSSSSSSSSIYLHGLSIRSCCTFSVESVRDYEFWVSFRFSASWSFILLGRVGSCSSFVCLEGVGKPLLVDAHLDFGLAIGLLAISGLAWS